MHQGMQLTDWRDEDRVVSRLKTHQGTAPTHKLERQGQPLSAGLKHSKAQQPPLSGEPGTGIISRLEVY